MKHSAVISAKVFIASPNREITITYRCAGCLALELKVQQLQRRVAALMTDCDAARRPGRWVQTPNGALWEVYGET